MRAAALTCGVTGSVIVLSTSAVSLGDRGLKSTSYATSSPGLAVLASLAGVALFGAATLLAVGRSRALTTFATLALAVAWSADVWAGWSRAPTALRNLAMLLVPLAAPLALLVVASMFGRTRFGYAGVAAAIIGLGAGLMLWLVRDPYADRYCWRDCLVHPFAPFTDASAARTATHVTLALNAACAGLAIVLSAVGIARRDLGRPLLGGVAVGTTLLVSNLALRLQPAEDPTRRLFASLFVANGLALAALGLALAAVAVRPRFVRLAISRLATNAERSAGGLTPALATALGDPGLRIGYPLPDGLVVDADGMPVALEGAPTHVRRGGELVAVVGSSAGGAPPRARLERALGPASRLALSNERLHAEQLHRLQHLTALRRRIVATGDTARRRIERDLHDGAQQRLLALAIDLQVALKRARAASSDEAAALIGAAAERVGEATAELRRIAHGIFPSTLANAGLVAALESLADERRLVLSIGIEPGRRFPAEIEAAAYSLAAEATSDEGTVRLALREELSSLVLMLHGATLNGGGAEERIGAAGGTLSSSGGRLEAVFPAPPSG